MNNTRGVFVLAAVLASLAGCDQKAARIHLETEYQAVYLDNGQVLYGRLEGAGSAYPMLRDVYYIQRQTDPETKEIKNVLLRRGSEWHAPSLMYINDRPDASQVMSQPSSPLFSPQRVSTARPFSERNPT